MSLNFDNDTLGLMRAVSEARRALIPQFQTIDADLDMIEEIRDLSAPFSDPGMREGPRLRRALKGAVSVQKNRWFWREQRAMELAAGLLRRMVLRDARTAAERRGVILFVVPYDIADSATGGASRLYGLAREMAATHEVRLISLVGPNREPDAIGLFRGVTLYIVPRTQAFERHVAEQAKVFGDAAALLSLPSGMVHLPLLAYWIGALGQDADVVFVDGPPLLETIRRELPGKPIIYESPNAYRKFVRVLAGEQTPMADAAMRQAGMLEAEMCAAARLVVCVSEEDRAYVARENGLPEARTLVVPNGVGTRQCLFFPPVQTARLKAFAGVAKPIALFVGSCHKPNIDAVGYIAGRLAPACPNVQFVAMGMAAAEFTRGAAMALPANLTFAGKVSGTDKEALFALSDVAISPVDTGSGSSLKIPDYAAHGKLIVSTGFGARGFDLLHPYLTSTELDGFAAALTDVLGLPANVQGERCLAARRTVETQYDWTRVAARLMAAAEPLARGDA